MENNIEFQGVKYNTREIIIEGYTQTVAGTDLLSCLLNDNGSYVSNEAENVDDRIFYFVEPDELKMSDCDLIELIESNL